MVGSHQHFLININSHKIPLRIFLGGPTYCQNMWFKICGRSRSRFWVISKIFINFFPRKNWTHILSNILSKYVVINMWWVATNASFTSFNLRFTLGHFFALGPLTSPNLNIAAIWVRDPWVSIQINFWGVRTTYRRSTAYM